MKKKCLKCNAIAAWVYMPGDSNYSYCDNCVPRGCSCNFECDENGNLIFDKDGKPIQFLDDQGRPLPCCEYDLLKKE